MSDVDIAVVDADNRFVRWGGRAEVHADRLLHRSVHVLLFDSAGRLLVQLRHGDKAVHPLHWDMSAAGHVERDDYPGGPDEGLDLVYAAVARRELGEELGVDTALRHCASLGPMPGVHYEHVRLYEGSWEGPVVLQADEVRATRWVTPAGFDALAASERVTPALVHWVGWLRGAGRFA